jgi:hypothetical protein
MPRNTFKSVPIEQRLWPKVIKHIGGCWEWTGSRTAPGWHGIIMFEGRRQVTHRVSWALAYGPIPKGLRVLHRCDNPPCVRPSHLYLGTQRDNALDMVARGRLNSSNARKTRCVNGHDLTPENTYRSPTHGRRQCRICRTAADHRRRAA